MSDSVPRYTRLKKLFDNMLNKTNWKLLLRIKKPGKKRIKSLKKCNRKSLKKINMISSARKSTISNPFIVFGFYDTLEKVMSEKQFFSSQIWILDETSFPRSTERCKVIASKGEVANKITLSRSWEYDSVSSSNTSTKAVDRFCSIEPVTHTKDSIFI